MGYVLNSYASPVFIRQSMVDANTVFSAGVTNVALTVALSTARTLTLPAANSLPAGTAVIFDDEIGGITSANTVAITRAGSDTINGLTTAFTLYTTNVTFCLITDGSSKWTGGIVASPNDGTYQAWIPSYTGFSAAPTGVIARYTQIGKSAFCNLFSTAGTSSGAASTFTITLPIAAANTAVQTMKMRGTDNGATADGCVLRTRLNSTTADVYPTGALGTWAVGSKNVVGNFFYETI